jgi:orotate phosphoribosyltransferase/AMMECR1 domain-containing protein
VAAELPASEDSWEQLRQLLSRDAFLVASEHQTITDRSGHRLPWLFYSWNATLSSHGTKLAARCLLDKLQPFTSTQLVGIGLTSIPLLTSCVLLSSGRYVGLVTRAAPKSYGAGRQLEGRGDTTKPVVIIDDSLVSGTSFYTGVRILESHGYQVEGLVCLVEFPWRGGRAWAESLGFRVESVFDISDLLQGSGLPASWPGLPSFVVERRSSISGVPPKVTSPGLLHPAVAARRVAEYYLETGAVLPSAHLDLDSTYGGRGGVFVSFRALETDTRIARDGFICLESGESDLASDLVSATIKTVRGAEPAIRQYGLSRLKIAVSLLGPLEEIIPCLLDCDRHGLVVRSQVNPWKVGATLPHTQFCTSEVAQYLQTRARARILPHEPHNLYRYSVTKLVEPRAGWPTFGAPPSDEALSDSLGPVMVERVRETLCATSRNTHSERTDHNLSDELVPFAIDGAVVSLYFHGSLIGCWVAWGQSIDSCVVQAAAGAWDDNRWNKPHSEISVDDLDVVVSLLHHPEKLGRTVAKQAASRLRLGVDALSASPRRTAVTIMPEFACRLGWSASEMAEAVARKANIGGVVCAWSTYQVNSWLSRKGRVWGLEWGFPVERRVFERTQATYNDDIAMLAEYIVNQLQPTGLPAYSYDPITDQVHANGSVGRVLFALAALEAAGQHLHHDGHRTLALAGLEICVSSLVCRDGIAKLEVPGLEGGLAAECQLLLTLARTRSPHLLNNDVTELANKVYGLFHLDGMITDGPGGRRLGSDHDLLPGVALTAAMTYNQATNSSRLLDHIDTQLSWYRRRFRVTHNWLLTVHHMLGWSQVYRLTANPNHSAFVFELADWALGWQLEKSGAFVTDLWPSGPSFHTAFIAEGIAAAWDLAKSVGDEERAEKYGCSWRNAMQFVGTLMLSDKDMYCMRNPARALGGVRAAQIGTLIRVDYVAHLLLALISGVQNL